MIATDYTSDHSGSCPCADCARDEADGLRRIAEAIAALPEEILARIEDLLTDAIWDAAHTAGIDPDGITRDDAWRALGAVWAKRMSATRNKDAA